MCEIQVEIISFYPKPRIEPVPTKPTSRAPSPSLPAGRKTDKPSGPAKMKKKKKKHSNKQSNHWSSKPKSTSKPKSHKKHKTTTQ